MERYDFIAIGGGNAGLTAAHKVRAAAKKVALIDPTPVGGLCSLRGCNPKKVLVRATEVLTLVQHAHEHGVRTGAAAIDWNTVIDRKHRFTDPVTGNTEKSLREAGIDYIKASPRFTATDELEIGGRMLGFNGGDCDRVHATPIIVSGGRSRVDIGRATRAAQRARAPRHHRRRRGRVRIRPRFCAARHERVSAQSQQRTAQE